MAEGLRYGQYHRLKVVWAVVVGFKLYVYLRALTLEIKTMFAGGRCRVNNLECRRISD